MFYAAFTSILNGKGITIRMSSSQLKHNRKIEGGFLCLLAGLAARALPMIAKTVLPGLSWGSEVYCPRKLP